MDDQRLYVLIVFNYEKDTIDKLDTDDLECCPLTRMGITGAPQSFIIKK